MVRDIEKELEVEFHRFIEFGNLLDKRMRTYLVQYLQNKCEPNKFILADLKEDYLDYFSKALDQIFNIDGLLNITTNNLQLRRQVYIDVLQWLKKAHRDSVKYNPYDDEKMRLESWSVTPLHVFIKRWTTLPTYLSGVYQRAEIDYTFFQNRFETLIGNHTTLEQIETENLELMINELLAQWDALLYAKILKFQLSKLQEHKEAYMDLMSKKVTEYQKIQEYINPFTNYLGWDFSRKLWKQSSFDVLNHYDDLLKNEKSIKELADLLGSMREAQIELEEEHFEKTIIQQRWVKDEMLKSEIVGVRNSNDLNHLLSSEAVLISDENTESLFLKRYADQKLLTFKYEDKRLIREENHFTEINHKIKQKEQGPFIICVDTSESMEGRPEQIAKVLCLAVLKMATNQNRKAYLINFSVGIQTLDLYDIANSIDDIAAFLNMSFYGGTDATLALNEAIRQLGTHEYEDADILMVSDFIRSKMEPEVEQKFKYHQQNKNTQFHCLSLSKNANESVLSIFDTNWVYDPKQKGIIKALSKGFEHIVNRTA